MRNVIGIDFGSSNTRIAVMQNGKPVVIPDVTMRAPRKSFLQIRHAAEDFLGQAVTEAVITVPTYSSESQRKALREAAIKAGFATCRIMNDSTAAILGYAFNKLEEDRTIAVFDLGGGAFDFSIYLTGDGVVDMNSVKGNTHLGGDDFDRVIVDWLVDEFYQDEGIDIRTDTVAMQRLREAACKAKIELSDSLSADINIPYIIIQDGLVRNINKKLTRVRFESLAKPLFESCIKACKDCLKASGYSKSDIDEYIMVGGSTRIPAIEQLLIDFFGKKPSRGFNPEEVVVLGAAIQGGIMAGEVFDVLALEVVPMSIGIGDADGKMINIIKAYSPIPCRYTDVFSTSMDNQKSVSVKLYQGESEKVAENIFIGEFLYDNIKPAPRAKPKIEITLDINANGVLRVTVGEK